MDTIENGVAVYGTEGMIHIGAFPGRKWGFKLFDREGQLVEHHDGPEPDTHAENFVDCIRSRKLPNADIMEGHLSTLHAHLANIVARTGRNLIFDAGSETVINDSEANLYVKRVYRSHWATPKIL